MSAPAEVTRDKLAERQRRAYAWALDVYGDRVKSARYQALRTLEEMMELCQTQGLNFHDMVRVAMWVCDRKVGDTKVELGDVSLSLDILAENLGLSIDSCHTACLNRIKGLDPEKCVSKDNQKTAYGMI